MSLPQALLVAHSALPIARLGSTPAATITGMFRSAGCMAITGNTRPLGNEELKIRTASSWARANSSATAWASWKPKIRPAWRKES